MDGSKVDTRRALAIANRLEFHHIFPKAYLERTGVSKSKANCHLNIAMVNLSNNRELSDRDPASYFLDMQDRLGDSFEPTLRSHYIDGEALEAAFRNDYAAFLDARERVMHDEISLLIDSNA